MRTALPLVAFTVFVQVAVAAGLIGACFMADDVDAQTVREYNLDRG
jgi:DMSO reductase anchor subunit